MTGSTNEDLQELRREMRVITAEIISKIQERTEVASRIGKLKSKLDMDIRDEKAAHEIRDLVISVAREKGLRLDFATQILNVLLLQSEQIQGSNRSNPPRPTHLAVFLRAKQMELSGKRIIHMEIGEPDYPAPTAAGVGLYDAFNQRRYRYTETSGIPELRAAIAEKESSAENEVIITPGGRFAVFASINGLLKSGDEVLIIEPAWPAYKECANFASISVNVIKTSLDGGWIPDIGELERNLNPNTRMVALNYPNNPTGAILPPKIEEEIVRLASERDIYLLSDEVYSFYSVPGFKSIRRYEYRKSIAVQSFSKTFAMTGFRIGYAVAEPSVIEAIKKVQAAAITSVPEPVQYAALNAIKTDPMENAIMMKKRLEYICSRLETMSLRFKRPEGAMYVFPELPDIEDIPFIESMLQKGVALAPGSAFGDSYSRHVRISACQPEETLGKGLDAMANSLNHEE